MLKRAGWSSPDNKIFVNNVLLYLIDYCTALRNDTALPNILEYDVLSGQDYGLDFNELVVTLNQYAPSMLNEITINNLDSPYIVDIFSTYFVLSNKEEY